MIFSNQKVSPFWGIPLIILVLSLQAYAAEKDAASFFDLPIEELANVKINVDVASLFKEDELRVGSTVASFDVQSWEKTGARRMHEVFDNEPSVMTYTTLGGAPAIAIRGYTTNFSSVRGLATLIDGVPLNTLSYGTALYGLPNWELGTLNKVEMIKGPGSAIYGSDAFHGVIDMKTFESDKDAYSASAGGGYPLYQEGNIKLSQGYADNRVRIDFSAAGSKQEDEDLAFKHGARGPGTLDNEYDSYASVLKISYQANDRLKLKLGGYTSGWNSEDFKGLGWLGRFNDLYESGYDRTGSDTRFYMGTASATYELPENIIMDLTGYYWQSYDKTHGDSIDLQYNTYLPGFSTSYQEQDDRRTGATLTIKQPDNQYNLQWLIAYSYTYLKTFSTDIEGKNELTGNRYNPSIYPNGKLFFDGLDRKIHSIFGQTKWGIVPDRLYLLLGCRYDRYSDVDNTFSPRAGLIFLPTATSAIKALYGRAYRAPVGAEIDGAVLTYGNRNLKSEQIDTYELIGMLEGQRYKLQVNGFYSKWSDGIFFESKTGLPGGFTSQYVNKGTSRSRGLEMKAYYMLKPFTLDAGFSYVKSERTGTDGDSYFDAFPAYMLQTGITYAGPLGLTMYLNNRLYFDMREATGDFITRSDKLPAYWRMDFTLQKTFSERLKCSLALRDIFDRENAKPSLWAGKDGVRECGRSVLFRVSYAFQ